MFPIRVRRPAAPLIVALSVGLALGGARAADTPSAIDRRVEEILSGMTLAEKIGQLNLASNNPTFDDGIVERGEAGGVLAFNNGRDIARVQAAARRSRTGLPLLIGLDILHGARTMFPLPLAEAGSFDPELARETARFAAREAASVGLNWTFAPMADLARDPRWGRAIEGFGEDPYLGRLFTAARVRGFREGGLATTLKHFVGYGAPEGGRDYDAVTLSPGDLYNVYLPPFQAGIEAGAESVMGGFHTLNGVPATANPALLTDLLRERMKFDGFVTSDWDAVEQLVDHGIAADRAAAARLALTAGTDVDMASGSYAGHLADAVRSGRLPEAAVTQAARRVVRAKLRMGLSDTATPELVFEVPPPGPDARALARRAARDAIVLLRNGGILPLAARRRIAVIGGMATTPEDVIGPHAALWRADDVATILPALQRRAAAAGSVVTHAPGCDDNCLSADGFGAAVSAVQDADVAIVVLGEPIDMTGEGGSRAHLTLPGKQAELLDRLIDTGKPVVLVLLASRPIELGTAVDRLNALLMAWYPGTEAGNAVADILFGDADPSAKLPVTWPRTVGQVPIHYDRLPTGRPHKPGNRYTLRYADGDHRPLFPFGFGQTYTRFALSDLVLSSATVRAGADLEARVRLRNEGSRPGREVVQLYVRQPVGTVSRPMKRLKAFAKVALQPGQEETVVLKVPAVELGYFREDGSYALEAGRFRALVGTSSDTVLAADFEVVP